MTLLALSFHSPFMSPLLCFFSPEFLNKLTSSSFLLFVFMHIFLHIFSIIITLVVLMFLFSFFELFFLIFANVFMYCTYQDSLQKHILISLFVSIFKAYIIALISCAFHFFNYHYFYCVNVSFFTSKPFSPIFANAFYVLHKSTKAHYYLFQVSKAYIIASISYPFL